MCLAIPTRVLEIENDGMIRVAVGNGSSELHVSGILLPEEVNVGDYLIVHAGFAMHKMETTEAEESLRLFRELVADSGEVATF